MGKAFPRVPEIGWKLLDTWIERAGKFHRTAAGSKFKASHPRLHKGIQDNKSKQQTFLVLPADLGKMAEPSPVSSC